LLCNTNTCFLRKREICPACATFLVSCGIIHTNFTGRGLFVIQIPLMEKFSKAEQHAPNFLWWLAEIKDCFGGYGEERVATRPRDHYKS